MRYIILCYNNYKKNIDITVAAINYFYLLNLHIIVSESHSQIYYKLRVDPPDFSYKLETWRFLRLVVRSHFRRSRTREERFLNSRRRAKNPADALCTREEGAYPEKEAERTRNGERKKREGRDKDVRYFLSSYTRPETSALPLFFQKTMSDSHGRVESFWLSISGKKLFRRVQGDRWKNIAANSPSRKGSTVWSTDFLPSISMALF